MKFAEIILFLGLILGLTIFGSHTRYDVIQLRRELRRTQLQLWDLEEQHHPGGSLDLPQEKTKEY